MRAVRTGLLTLLVSGVLALAFAGAASATTLHETPPDVVGEPAASWARGPYPYYWSGASAGAWRRGDGSADWNDVGLGWRRAKSGLGGIHAHWSYRAGYTAARFDYTMRPKHDGVDGLHFARAYLLGINLPHPNFDLSLMTGLGYLDESTRVNGAVGGHVMLQASVWPVWPVGVFGWVDVGAYREGTTTLDWALEGRLQLYRGLSLSLGWRESRLLESGGSLGGFGQRGLTLGLSLSFSSLRVAFAGKQSGVGPNPDW